MPIAFEMLLLVMPASLIAAAIGVAFSLGLGPFAFEVSLFWRVYAALGDGDAVEGAVELAVAAAVES